MTVVNRKPNPYNSTFPTEIVTCRIGNKGTLRLFVKYGTKRFDGVYGHRGDVSYEAKVYSEVLQPLGTTAPAFYGIYHDKTRGTMWLITEYLPGGSPASWSKDPRAMIRSANWIGRFHALNENRFSSRGLKFLRKYDTKYYVGWADRTNKLFRHWQPQYPWLSTICEEFEALIPRLLEAPKTVIHGEYFGSNIVYQNGTSRPIDWQSAAIAPGEVDLASLTHSWPRQIVRSCERQYMRSRWPGGVPDCFEETLEVARVYMNLRWLGDPGLMSPLFGRDGRLVVSKNLKRFLVSLHSVGERLGLI